MQAPNCRLQEIDLRLDLATLRDRGFTPLFEAAQSCRHLKVLKVAGELDADYGSSELDNDACQALSDLLRSSAVLATLSLANFSFTLEALAILASGLASCKSATALLLPECKMSEGSLELVRTHLDELAHLEELALVVSDEECPDVLRFLRDATLKLPRLRSLCLDNWTDDTDLEALEAVANTCVEYAMANPHLHNLEILVPWEKRFHTQRNELRFILRLNRLGRLHLHPSHDIPLALWPTILARMTDSIDDRGALQ